MFLTLVFLFLLFFLIQVWVKLPTKKRSLWGWCLVHSFIPSWRKTPYTFIYIFFLFVLTERRRRLFFLKRQTPLKRFFFSFYIFEEKSKEPYTLLCGFSQQQALLHSKFSCFFFILFTLLLIFRYPSTEYSYFLLISLVIFPQESK